MIANALELEIVGMIYTRARGAGKISAVDSAEVRRAGEY